MEQSFDRVAGDQITAKQLKTYAEVLAQYHLSSENKFENGGFLDKGETKRRHAQVDNVSLIRKESNKVEVSGEAHPLACNSSYIEQQTQNRN